MYAGQSVSTFIIIWLTDENKTDLFFEKQCLFMYIVAFVGGLEQTVSVSAWLRVSDYLNPIQSNPPCSAVLSTE